MSPGGGATESLTAGQADGNVESGNSAGEDSECSRMDGSKGSDSEEGCASPDKESGSMASEQSEAFMHKHSTKSVNDETKTESGDVAFLDLRDLLPANCEDDVNECESMTEDVSCVNAICKLTALPYT